jgi:ribokinase
LIVVGRNGENCIAVASGANARLGAADVASARDEIRSAKALLLQLEIPLPAVRKAAAMARSAGALVILNPAPAQRLDDLLLANTDVLTPNESEAQALTGIEVRTRKDMDEAARLLRARGVKTVVITLGARGAFVCAEGIAAIVSGFKVEPVDTTAAGDVFSGALAVALAEGRPLAAAARFANAAAALSVTRLGAQPSAPVRRDIDRLLTERAR